MPERTIADFKRLLADQPTAALLAAAQADPRKGVQQAYQHYLRQAEKQAALVTRFNQHMRLERDFGPTADNTLLGSMKLVAAR